MSSGRDRVALAVVAVAVAGTAARLAGVGARPFHWDEARVGYWALRAVETGTWSYRPIAGGPLPTLLARRSIGLFGASDAAARLPVALVGGAAPLVALLFGEALSDAETVVFSGMLAAAPPLLYYSRFLRGDVPLAVFGLATVGLVAHYRAQGNRRALYAAGATLGLAAASSAFVLAYVGCWAIAGWLTVDHGRVRGRSSERIVARWRALADGLRGAVTPLARTLFVFLGVVAVTFAPRPALASPAEALVDATAGAARRLFGVRILARRFTDHAFLPFVVDHAATLATGGVAIAGLGIAGIALDRYGPADRPVVRFAGFWALASLLVIPVATEVAAPWTVVHTVAPLCLPAAVAGGRLVHVGRRAVVAGDGARALAAAAVAVAVVTGIAGGAAAAYDGGASGPLVDYGQPADDLGAVADRAAAAAAGDDSAVVYVGASTYAPRESDLDRPPVTEVEREAFAARLPLSWYFAAEGLETRSVESAADLSADPPPVVVVPGGEPGVDEQLGGSYERTSVETAAFDRSVVVFVRTN